MCKPELQRGACLADGRFACLVPILRVFFRLAVPNLEQIVDVYPSCAGQFLTKVLGTPVFCWARTLDLCERAEFMGLSATVFHRTV